MRSTASSPSLLDLLVESLQDDTTAREDTRALAKKSQPKPQTKSNMWRQHRRLEVLRLRDEAKQLDEELKQMKLAAGVRSTVPLVSSACSIQTHRSSVRLTVKRLLGESWQDAASRESLARQMADERLHKVLRVQVKHARKLHDAADDNCREPVDCRCILSTVTQSQRAVWTLLTKITNEGCRVAYGEVRT